MYKQYGRSDGMWLRGFLGTAFLVASGMLMSVGSVPAQDSERLKPKQLEEAGKKAESVPQTPAPQESKDKGQTVLTQNLAGLVFVSSPGKIIKSGNAQSGVVVDGHQEPEFFEQMESYLGKPLTLNGLNEILRKVVMHFRETDRPVVDVYAPEQDVSKGTIQIVVIVGRLGAIRTEGNRWFEDDQLTRLIRLKPGEVIRGRQLVDDLNWINQNPFRQVDLVFARGDRPGETDIILKAKDRLPVRVFSGYEDSGTEFTGRGRVLTGFNWGNVFGTDHQLNYQYTADREFSQFSAHSVSYSAPLPWRHTVSFSASYARSQPDFDFFDMKGKSWKLAARYTVPLKKVQRYAHYFRAGLDYNYSDNNLEFSNIPVFDKRVNVVQAVTEYGGMLPDRLGSTAFNASLVFSPGELARYNKDEYFQDMHPDARARYFYSQIGVERVTSLPANLTWKAKLDTQFASRTLIDSERMGLGGYDRVRGYEEREISGDGGVILVNEALTEPFNIGRIIKLDRDLGQLQFLAFLDYGHAINHGGEASPTLASTGAGLRYKLGSYVSLRFDYGWQINKSADSGNKDSRAHFGVVAAF